MEEAAVVQENHHIPATAPEPTLGDLLRDLWRAKFYLLFGGLAGFLAVLTFLHFAVPHYRAAMIVAPADRGTGPDIKALLPDNSSFAVQYMVNTLGSQDSGDYMRFEHTLRAPSTAALLLEDPRITEGVAQDKSYVFEDMPAIDSPEKLAAYLEDKVSVEPVVSTPMRRLVYTHPDRDFARYLLSNLHIAADGLIRQDIRGKTQRRTAYLEKALETVSHPDHRRALTSLLMEQEHVRMILAMDEPFAATITEPPFSGVRPHWPKPALFVPLFILCGMMFGYAVYTVRRKS